MAVDPFTPIVLSAEGAALTISVLPYGLTVHSLSTQLNEDFIAGPQEPIDHQKGGRAFLNPIIGRFANRLPAGKSEYKSANGSQYQVDLPEFSGAGVVLHGGPESIKENQRDSILQHGPLDKCYWQPLEIKDSQFFADSGYTSTASPGKQQSSLVFAIESPDGDSGYPGKLRIETLVAIVPSSNTDHKLGKAAGRALIRYRAALASDSTVEATPLNLTHHWSFNVSASDEQAGKSEKGEVSDHVVEMFPPAGKRLYQLDLDGAMIATGKLNETSSDDPSTFSNPGSHHWDKTGGKKVSEGIPDAGYDDFYVWGKDEGIPQSDDVNAIANDATKRLRFTSEAAGRSLIFYTNQAGTQLYTAEGQPQHPADPAQSGGKMKQVHRKGGLPDSGNFKRSYAAIEFGGPHCGFLHEGLLDVGGREEILDRGQVYDNWVVCEAWSR